MAKWFGRRNSLVVAEVARGGFAEGRKAPGLGAGGLERSRGKSNNMRRLNSPAAYRQSLPQNISWDHPAKPCGALPNADARSLRRPLSA
jgi:hypothetical protein